ncbi:MAG: hypothetical protein J6K03_04245, partial [Oscillospiraceae bacterium]|nr:hypothetical protein [Oscillospiraceae bacterium]
MRSKAGIICMVLGAALVFGALLLSRSNQREDTAAREAVMDVMPQLVQQIRENTASEETVSEAYTIPELQIPVELLTEEDKEMTEV